VFKKVFCADIERVRGMEELWKTHAKPAALSLATLLPGVHEPDDLTTSAPQASKPLGLDPQLARVGRGRGPGRR